MKPILIAILFIVTVSGSMRGQLDRTVRPEPGPTPPLTLPEIQRSSLDNGLAIMLVEHHELPVVEVSMVIMSGSAHDPPGMAGLADLTTSMMDEGTGKRDALQIADDLEFLGASVSVSSGLDASTASLVTLKEHLGPAMEIYADVLLDPSFPETEWERVRKSHLTSLLQQKDRPGTVAGKVFNLITFGPEHPYGRPSDGTEESVESITIADMRRFYSEHFRPNNATVIVVGDVTMPEVREVLETYFRGWKAGSRIETRTPAPAPVASTRIYLIDKPEAAQSEIRIGHVGVNRGTADYFALTVMNTILGGQFSSRINMNLRETKGYTYGARTGFSMRKEAGPFTASAAVKSAVTDSSVIEFMSELNRMINEDVTEDELQFAKNSLIRREPRNFETPGQIAGQLESLVLYGLPDDYFATYVQNFQKVSIADVRRVAERYLHPAEMNIVIVGDVAEVRDGLGSLGYGDVVMLDADGNRTN
ncbi:MAG: insulinase family protein [Ignavibacteria bacterium]|nr:insulinase family protein [Ignavibacteria bacterium]